VDGKKYPKLCMILPAWSVQKAASRRNLRSRRRADAEGETGIRGFINGKDSRLVSKVVIVQALKVVLEPNLCKEAFAAKGNATPVTLLAAHMIPRASPFFCMNHWSIYRDDGLNMSALPMAHIIP
jgi:hypothetical protein